MRRHPYDLSFLDARPRVYINGLSVRRSVSWSVTTKNWLKGAWQSMPTLLIPLPPPSPPPPPRPRPLPSETKRCSSRNYYYMLGFFLSLRSSITYCHSCTECSRKWRYAGNLQTTVKSCLRRTSSLTTVGHQPSNHDYSKVNEKYLDLIACMILSQVL